MIYIEIKFNWIRKSLLVVVYDLCQFRPMCMPKILQTHLHRNWPSDIYIYIYIYILQINIFIHAEQRRRLIYVVYFNGISPVNFATVIAVWSVFSRGQANGCGKHFYDEELPSPTFWCFFCGGCL